MGKRIIGDFLLKFFIRQVGNRKTRFFQSGSLSGSRFLLGWRQMTPGQGKTKQDQTAEKQEGGENSEHGTNQVGVNREHRQEFLGNEPVSGNTFLSFSVYTPVLENRFLLPVEHENCCNLSTREREKEGQDINRKGFAFSWGHWCDRFLTGIVSDSNVGKGSSLAKGGMI